MPCGSATVAESSTVMSPVPSSNSAVRPSCTTTWPGFSAAYVTSVRTGSAG
ncbi:Uncharacterised protein [Mycobacteroides abscessus]|nr:Uncharacterised protein [Mycobacteroides abscessus]